MADHSFILCVDEAGDDGVERVKPLDEDGSSEYFVMAGVLYSANRHYEIVKFIEDLKSEIGIGAASSIHFRDLDQNQKNIVLDRISDFRIGVSCVVSNKRNMRSYRNRRVEEKHAMFRNGRRFVPKVNWFYNSILRYLLEAVTLKCKELSDKFYLSDQKIKVIMEYRRGFSYTQTRTYLRKMEIESRPRSYFNNKRRPIFSVLDIDALEALRSHQHAGLQIADCIASAVYQAIDHNAFKDLHPDYIKKIKGRFLSVNGEIREFGFKLLPDNFDAPTTSAQKEAFAHVGYFLRN